MHVYVLQLVQTQYQMPSKSALAKFNPIVRVGSQDVKGACPDWLMSRSHTGEHLRIMMLALFIAVLSPFALLAPVAGEVAHECSYVNGEIQLSGQGNY